ncbi:MAG TPA: hypothetical protein VF003_12905 [Pseudonocardiaceae bacterium]
MLPVGGGAWCGDSEHGDDSFLGDADLGDERFDGGFAFGRRAAGDDVGEVVLDRLDGAGRGHGGLGADRVGEFCGAGLELGDLGLEDLEPVPGGGVVHGAVLECLMVPVDGGFFGLDLGEDGAVLGVPVGVAVAVAGLGSGDGVGDEVTGLGVEVA